MTQEMVRTILRLALRRLACLSPRTLAREVPWLTQELVQDLLANVHRLVWEDDEYQDTKRQLTEMLGVLRKEKETPC